MKVGIALNMLCQDGRSDVAVVRASGDGRPRRAARLRLVVRA